MLNGFVGKAYGSQCEIGWGQSYVRVRGLGWGKIGDDDV